MFYQTCIRKLIPFSFTVRSKATYGEIIFYCVDKYPDLQTYSARWGSHLYRNKLRCPCLSQVTQVCHYYITLLHMLNIQRTIHVPGPVVSTIFLLKIVYIQRKLITKVSLYMYITIYHLLFS